MRGKTQKKEPNCLVIRGFLGPERSMFHDQVLGFQQTTTLIFPKKNLQTFFAPSFPIVNKEEIMHKKTL
jgi:hypothetical protein